MKAPFHKALSFYIVFQLFFFAFIAHANTITVGASEQYKTISQGLSALSSGGTLILKDGSYSGTANTISNVPNGTAQQYTIIKAENDGKAVINASEGLALSHTNAYAQIEGLKFDSPTTKSILGNHIKLLRCSFKGGPTTGNVVQVAIGTNDYSDTKYILLEDCWMYGAGGRYNLLIYNSDNVVIRRCVIRHDGGWTDTKGDPEAGTNAYSSSNVYYQNCVVLDSNLNTYHNWYSPFYATADNSESNISWNGCIALNNLNAGFQLDPKSGASLNNVSINNSVSYKNGWGITLGSTGTVSGVVSNVTIGSIPTNDGIAKWNSTGTVNVKNSVLFSIGGYSLRGVAGAYCNTYNTGNNGSGTGFIHLNPLTSGLLYLPRIESDSALKTAGENWLRKKTGV